MDEAADDLERVEELEGARGVEDGLEVDVLRDEMRGRRKRRILRLKVNIRVKKIK